MNWPQVQVAPWAYRRSAPPLPWAQCREKVHSPPVPSSVASPGLLPLRPEMVSAAWLEANLGVLIPMPGPHLLSDSCAALLSAPALSMLSWSSPRMASGTRLRTLEIFSCTAASSSAQVRCSNDAVGHCEPHYSAPHAGFCAAATCKPSLQPALQYMAGAMQVQAGMVLPLLATHNTIRWAW